jgi:hypothetical protein
VTLRVAATSLIIMRHPIVAALLVAAASSTARAETPAPKDPTTATLTSVGATLLPVVVGAAIVENQDTAGAVLISAGLILGPSAGHWYAGEGGWVGLSIRGAAVGAMVLVANDAAGCYIGDGGEEGKNCKLAQTVFMVGLGAFAGGVIYDWVTAGDSARRANTRTIAIAPTVISGPRSAGSGLAFAAKF